MSDQSGNEQKQGDLAQEILNKVITDANFRQQLLDNPVETLSQAGYTVGDDVSGYSLMASMARGAKGPAQTAMDDGGIPITTAIDRGSGGGITTAINCGGGVTPKPKPPVTSNNPKLSRTE